MSTPTNTISQDFDRDIDAHITPARLRLDGLLKKYLAPAGRLAVDAAIWDLIIEAINGSVELSGGTQIDPEEEPEDRLPPPRRVAGRAHTVVIDGVHRR